MSTSVAPVVRVDVRLCTRAQWEFRKVAAMMRAEVNRNVPELGLYLQPKCGEKRWGYCDEDYEAWQSGPIGRKRPHKRDMFQIFDSYPPGRTDPPGRRRLQADRTRRHRAWRRRRPAVE